MFFVGLLTKRPITLLVDSLYCYMMHAHTYISLYIKKEDGKITTYFLNCIGLLTKRLFTYTTQMTLYIATRSYFIQNCGCKFNTNILNCIGLLTKRPFTFLVDSLFFKDGFKFPPTFAYRLVACLFSVVYLIFCDCQLYYCQKYFNFDI